MAFDQVLPAPLLSRFGPRPRHARPQHRGAPLASAAQGVIPGRRCPCKCCPRGDPREELPAADTWHGGARARAMRGGTPDGGAERERRGGLDGSRACRARRPRPKNEEGRCGASARAFPRLRLPCGCGAIEIVVLICVASCDFMLCLRAAKLNMLGCRSDSSEDRAQSSEHAEHVSTLTPNCASRVRGGIRPAGGAAGTDP